MALPERDRRAWPAGYAAPGGDNHCFRRADRAGKDHRAMEGRDASPSHCVTKEEKESGKYPPGPARIAWLLLFKLLYLILTAHKSVTFRAMKRQGRNLFVFSVWSLRFPGRGGDLHVAYSSA